MHVIFIILILFLIYSIPAFLALIFSKEIQITLYYVTLGVLFCLTQLFNTLYNIQISSHFSLNGGDISYSALLFTAVFLFLTQPEPKIVRNLIYTFFILSLFLVLLFYFIKFIISTEIVINILDVPLEFLEFSYISMIFSFILFSSEIFLLLFLFKKVIPLIQKKILSNLVITSIYIIILILDGILYPIGINILFAGEFFSVLNGIVAKSIFGIGFGLNIFIFLTFFPTKKFEFTAVETPFKLYLLPPKKKILVNQLQNAQNEINTLRNILPICSTCKKVRSDDGYWNQVEDYLLVHNDLRFSHGLCPDCMAKLVDEFELD
ncbi:hypothetical protein NEF87_001215 [Candidatus Lokiarchaeum ossiferum]|uniref:Vitamin uptake-like sensor domain-containing protein n=1 Tax=Candidatus Lokiarchaeum ossiferum TaxID=2951803 RepID=A0ABY6HNF6_9ARCH|nr:hypothetical protein NEF87_001215 [Candidatus Lokiarchaeum sp. B-35]